MIMAQFGFEVVLSVLSGKLKNKSMVCGGYVACTEKFPDELRTFDDLFDEC